MHDNVEKIFDDFIKDKLDEFLPGEILMESSYNSFLAERQQKKRRGFFWIFFPLLFIGAVISYFYYVGDLSFTGKSIKEVSSGYNQSSNKNKPARQSPMADGLTNKSSKKLKSSNVLPSAIRHNKFKLEKTNLATETKEDQNQGSVIELMRNHPELILTDRKNQISRPDAKIDSIKKEIKKPIEDTFYIVW